ncbi:MAG TPA: radical SAM protein, partial [Myxococcota bacterium]|nr:radical SAM protein [Myxococcota bacterium]
MLSTTEVEIESAGLGRIREKVEAGERLTFEDGVALFRCPDLTALGALANRERERRHGDLTYFNRNVHVNATNVCEASCIFCSFSRLKTGDAAAYTMSLDEAVGRVKALRGELITEVHIVNGLNPDLPWDYYPDLLRGIKAERPDIHIKGFTAVEIHYFAEKYGMSYEQVLIKLREAGLGSLPGGGAEIFHPRARKKLCDDKVGADGWLEVHRVAHRLGMRSNCTMLFGSIDPEHEVAALEQVLEREGAPMRVVNVFDSRAFSNRARGIRAMGPPDQPIDFDAGVAAIEPWFAKGSDKVWY